ncbi:MAG: hypothetical protein CMH52_03770 [Myxococcales bacterium]|nr:hypothetical protein [Myxococcales bacterium]
MPFILILCLLLSPAAALACGGLFCNARTPVNQAAERILFSKIDDGLEMHVRITYQGPPTEFGWLLPVPRDVEYGLSTDQLFTQLDNQFGPRFNLRTEVDDDCIFDSRNGAEPELFEAGGADTGVQDDGADSVAVLSREAVGPYDLSVLLPTSVDALRDWLDANEYQIPDAADATLAPYVEMGSAFIALKLLPAADSGDVQPLSLRFAGDIPAVPIVPTSVAANPDMGIIVHLLADARGVSTNYRHVAINESTIDWGNRGSNYPDVVSQAVDEAGGQAFVTDFAGAHESAVFLATVSEDALDAIRRIGPSDDGAFLWGRIESILRSELNQNDSDLARIARGVISLPETIDINEFLMRPRRFEGSPSADLIQVDIDALVARLGSEINDVRQGIGALFSRNPYLTRLYSTMSPEEMTVDPVFAWNRDLESQSNVYNAVRRVSCVMGRPDWDNAIIETESGLRFRERDGANPNVIVRQEGETIRQSDVPGASVIEIQMPAGQTQVVTDNRPEISQKLAIGSNTGCACSSANNDQSSGLIWFALLCLWPLHRRVRFQRS